MMWPPRQVVVVADPAVAAPLPRAQPLFRLADPVATEATSRSAPLLARMVWCAVASALMPGLGQAMQRRWLAALLFGVQTIAVGLLVARVLSQDNAELLKWAVDSTTLHILFAGGLVWAVVCAIAASDAARTARPWPSPTAAGRLIGRGAVVLIALIALVPGVAVAAVAMRQDALLDTVFAGSGRAVTAQPSPLADLEAPPSPSAAALAAPANTDAPAPVAPPPTAAPPPAPAPAPTPAAAPTIPPVPADRWTVALLGGDAGPHRWGLRTDTMMVLSVEHSTGDAVVISVPRNLQRLPMPAGPLRRRFPSGFDDLANAVYPYVMSHPDLELDPAEAVKGALAELLGIPIDNYVLVDMAGFIKIIDALGGVDIDLSKRVPLVPNIDGRTIEARSVGPGPVHMNGAMALAFSRTRELDSDYARMQRQRCLMASVARGLSPTDLAANYLGLARAVEDAFRSDIPRDQLGALVDVFAKMTVDQVRGLALVPPVIQPAHPNIAEVRKLVSRALDPGRAADESEPSMAAC
jgi:LCP family protein required for cell wall assembly